MTISKTPRRDMLNPLVGDGITDNTEALQQRFDIAARKSQGSPDAGPDALARAPRVVFDFTDQQTDIPPPPAPWQESAWRGDFEPVDRETWRPSFADYWHDVKPVVLCAMFVATVLAVVAHRVGFWPS